MMIAWQIQNGFDYSGPVPSHLENIRLITPTFPPQTLFSGVVGIGVGNPWKDDLAFDPPSSMAEKGRKFMFTISSPPAHFSPPSHTLGISGGSCILAEINLTVAATPISSSKVQARKEKHIHFGWT